MTRRLAHAAALAIVLGAAGCSPADGPIRASVRARVDPERHGVDSRFPMVVRFYRARDFHPAWTTSIGARREAFELEVALDRAQAEGVERKGSEAMRIHDLLGELRPTLFGPLPPPRRLAELEVLLTRSYFASAAQVVGGRVHARDLPIDWRTGPRATDLVADLGAALRERRVGDALRQLDPSHPDYAALRDAWTRYRALDAVGGWRRVGPGPRLRVGRIAARVTALRERLAAEEELAPPLADSARYDFVLAQAVRRFQRRYGLDTTGVVGPRDIEALDVPTADRARQIELNLVRWHWVPDSLGARYVLVNIPEFALRVVEQDRVVSTMRVVVGKPDWPTPVFSSAVRYVVFNPLWNVPATIASGEVLGEVQNDPDYLARNNIRVYDGEGRDAHEVDPATVHWSFLTADNLPYSFRQDPGPANPVGHVKFMCPNPFSVYLHDTPSSQYFRRTERAYSHGCVRVEKPLDLAEFVLAGRPGWDRAGIAAAVDTSRNQAVGVPAPLPVHILYFTAWVDENGQVEFRRDLYGLDDLLDRALKGLPLPTREQLDQARDQNSLVRVTSNPSER
ncbi:MAG TPA: L,D-transpeptidase family protein [Candidatus Eisenbacteria bacterium]